MQVWSTLLLVGLTLNEFGLAVPIQDSPRQRLLDGKPLPGKYRKTAKNPYAPGNYDPLDKSIDAVGRKLDPLPYRNGLGTSVLGYVIINTSASLNIESNCSQFHP